MRLPPPRVLDLDQIVLLPTTSAGFWGSYALKLHHSNQLAFVVHIQNLGKIGLKVAKAFECVQLGRIQCFRAGYNHHEFSTIVVLDA
jgi:hypothetical protein